MSGQAPIMMGVLPGLEKEPDQTTQEII